MSIDHHPSSVDSLSSDATVAQDLYAAAHKFDRDGAVEFIRLYLRLYRGQILQQQLELQLRQRRRRAGSKATA